MRAREEWTRKPTSAPRPRAAGREPLVQVRDVHKSFGGAPGQGAITALRGVSLDVEEGQMVAITGKSGSGKSTLLNAIAGIDRVTAGTVTIGGVAVHQLSEGRLAAWRGRNVGVVFQFFQLLPTLTVLENVMLPMDFLGALPRAARRERAGALLARVGIEDQAHKLPATLSGGQQQRAAIARALANDPAILVADEPTGNLDSRTANEIFGLFQELSAAGKTVLIVTHERELARRCPSAVALSDGLIVESSGVPTSRAS